MRLDQIASISRVWKNVKERRSALPRLYSPYPFREGSSSDENEESNSGSSIDENPSITTHVKQPRKLRATTQSSTIYIILLEITPRNLPPEIRSIVIVAYKKDQRILITR